MIDRWDNEDGECVSKPRMGANERREDQRTRCYFIMTSSLEINVTCK